MQPSIRAVFAVVALAANVSMVAYGPAWAQDSLRFTGVNIAGAEFAHRKVPGKHATDYFYPSPSTVNHFAAAGMNTVRVPFLWERIQSELHTGLIPDELARLDAVVRHATSRRVNVVLDVHNYAAYRRQPIGTPDVPVHALADLWARLAERYKNNSNVIFGLMNEPKGLRTETWLEAANAAIAAIRKTGAKNLILVPGNGWTGAHSWLGSRYGTANGDVMRGIADPAQNFAYEVHQYLDGDFSGTKPQCRNEGIGVKALTAFTQWLKQNGARGFLGEFGGGSDPTCLAALDGMLKYMHENSDVWIGWTYWAAGPWPRDYFTSVQPIDGSDRPQMQVLRKYVARRGAPAGN